MTTAEKFRRRQRIEGFLILVLAFCSLGYGVWDNDQSKQRDACMASSFRDLGDTLTLRTGLAEAATSVTTRVDARQDRSLGLQRRAIEDVAAAQDNGSEIRDAFEEFRLGAAELEQEERELEREQAIIARQRRNTDIAPFPEGKCE